MTRAAQTTDFDGNMVPSAIRALMSEAILIHRALNAGRPVVPVNKGKLVRRSEELELLLRLAGMELVEEENDDLAFELSDLYCSNDLFTWTISTFGGELAEAALDCRDLLGNGKVGEAKVIRLDSALAAA